jgi:hypothetical protein
VTHGASSATDEPARLSGWFEFVQSNAAIRFAAAKVELGLDIPVLSADPFRQWLLEEAILTRYTLERAEDEKRRAERAEAEEKARRFSKGEEVPE